MSEHANPSVGLEAIDSPKLSSAFSIKELDQRINDGITVRLLWEEKTNTVWVDVQDKKKRRRIYYTCRRRPKTL
jgi:threonine aldolase